MNETEKSKNFIWIGASFIVVILLLSATAVPNVSANIVLNPTEKKSDEMPFSMSDLVNMDYENFTADTKRVKELNKKMTDYLDDNKINIDEYQTSEFFNMPEMQEFFNGLEEDLADLDDECADRYYEFWKKGYEEDEIIEKIVDIIKDFFTDLFSGSKYNNVIKALETEHNSFADELEKVYKNNKNKGLSNLNSLDSSENNKEKIETKSQGAILEKILIGICTFGFFVMWIGVGNTGGEIVEPIVALIFTTLILIPAAFILVTELISEFSQVALEAFLTATTIIIELVAGSFKIAHEEFGFIGKIVWVACFLSGVPESLLGILWFVIFVYEILSNSGVGIGYILKNILPYALAIVKQAAENARALYEQLKAKHGETNNCKNLTIFDKFRGFLNMLMKKFGLHYELFS